MSIKKRNNVSTELSVEVLEDSARVLKLLAHPHRLKIVELLVNEPEGMPVHLITKRLRVPQATVSQHLGAMQRVGLLKGSRKKQEVWYRICDERPLKILNCIRRRSK